MLIRFVLSDSLKLDHDICESVKSITMTSRAELHDLQRGHCEKTKVITGNADTSLGDDYTVRNISLFGIYIRIGLSKFSINADIYCTSLFTLSHMMVPYFSNNELSVFMNQVDEVTCSTPRRREIKIPSSQSIGELVTPPLEDLAKAFWDSRTPTKLDLNGNGKQSLLGSTPENQRAPLAAIN